MKTEDLFDIFQNVALSSIAIHSFVLAYQNVSKHRSLPSIYPKVNKLFYVLPIVYNEGSMKAFSTSNQLYTAINDNKVITLGLQDRANKMSGQTLNAIHLLFAKQILTYNRNDATIEIMHGFKSKRLPLPLIKSKPDDQIKNIVDASHKLGSIFAKVHDKNLQSQLNIRF